MFARFGERILGPWRRRVLQRAAGRTLEIGAGTGANLPHYPSGLVSITLSEPNAHMRRRLRKAAEAAPIELTLDDSPAEALGFPDASFDTVVATLVLCSVRDPAASLSEIRRVLVPGGSLVVLEHVRSADPAAAARQDRWERPWGWIAGGCHPNRDTLSAIEEAGFVIEDAERFDLATPRLVRPHIFVAARTPERSAG